MNKQEQIINMFDDIAPTYDKTNRILSLGIDIKWRQLGCDLALKYASKASLKQIIDVACGTGDMMKHWQERAKKANIDIQNIIGIDPSSKMLQIGKQKFDNFTFLQGSAENLPIKDESADIVSISYGIRNVVERKKALSEFKRILKQNGLVVILEFTKSEKKGFLYDMKNFYLQNILPKIGGFISKNKAAYEYLPNSIEGFLSSKKLIQELENEGFKMLYCKGFSMDISTLFIAQKI